MPPRRSTESSKAALRKSRGKDADTINRTAADPAPRLLTSAQSVAQCYYPLIRKQLRRYIDETFPDGSWSYDAVMTHNSSVALSYGFLTGFLLWWGLDCQGQGRSGPDQSQHHVNSLYFRLNAFHLLYRETVGRPVDGLVRARATEYIKTELVDRLDLSTDPPRHSWFGASDWQPIVVTILSTRFGVASYLSRLRFLFWFSTAISTSIRVGALLRRNITVTDQSPLRWRDLTLCIFQGKDTSPNRIGIKTVTPNGKSKNSANLTLLLSDHAPLWINPVFYLLSLASMIGALPSGWTIEELFDPASFNNRGTTCVKLSFNPLVAATPVFESEAYGGKPAAEWTIDSISTILEMAGESIGFDRRLTPHSVRRSSALAMKIAGKSHLGR